ncbi:MAG: NAD(P)H nitroreductase, partial [Bacteroidetes bacterium CG_4_9_14_3_um_filter_41_19]
MDFYELINLRHSVRGYNHERPVEKEKLLRILEAGRVAPSAANKQPWTFVVVTSENMLEAIHQSYVR